MATFASSLHELALLREENRDQLERVPNYLGSALGFKRRTGQPVSDEPAVLVFVDRKVSRKWLPRDAVVPPVLRHAGGLECPTDVIEGAAEDGEVYFWKYASDGTAYEAAEYALMSRSELTQTDPLSAENLRLLEHLRGWGERIGPGCQLHFEYGKGGSAYGTLGCFARDKVTGELGFLTNEHVGEVTGAPLRHPDAHGRRVGVMSRHTGSILGKARYPGLIDGLDSRSIVDAGYCLLDPSIGATDLDPRQPRTSPDGPPERVQLKQPVPVDLATMGHVGQSVVGVGRTRGFQRGTVHACAYETRYDGMRTFSDYLIVGEGTGEFSDPGDSGTLIVRADDDRPIAMLWGGSWARRRHGARLENWTEATDVVVAAAELNIELVLGPPMQ